MGVFEQEIISAHCEQQNLGSLRQGAELLHQAVGKNDTETVITAADWVTEVAQRIKLSSRIKSRVSHIDTSGGQRQGRDND